MASFTTHTYIHGNKSELEVEVEFEYSYDPGRYSGPWEDCYPESSDFQISEMQFSESKLDFDDFNNRLFKRSGIDISQLIEDDIIDNLDQHIGEY